MDGGAPYHWQGAVGMAEVWKSAATIRGIYPGVSPVLQDSDTGGSDVWVRFMFNFIHDC